MKKSLLIAMMVPMVGFGSYYNGDTLITFNEPITVRVMDVYSYDWNTTPSSDDLAKNYTHDWVVTNMVANKVYYNYTKIDSDYQIELAPTIYGGESVYTTHDIGSVPGAISIRYDKPLYSGYSFTIYCKRIVGYLVNDRWVDKDGNDITDKFLALERMNEIRNIQRAGRIQPDMKLNSVINMQNNTPSISFDIVYSGEKIVWGKKELTDTDWIDVTNLDKSEFRFFKVTLKSK